jgi:hypothetical protein
MKKTHVMLHHSLTADSDSVSWGAIRKYHVETKGWDDIGYHVGVEKIGDYYEVILGRAFDEDGAHCKEGGVNKFALGVCFVGNFDLAPPPAEMMTTAARHLRSIMADLGITADAEHVVMHRQFATYKSCPGTQFPFAAFLQLLATEA